MRVGNVVFILVALALPTAHSMWTCSHGTLEHDWIAFDNFADDVQVKYLTGVISRLPRELRANAKTCMKFVSGVTIGWHTDTGTTNGIDNDDYITKKYGCESPVNINVKDQYARAAALITCSLYVDNSLRVYGLNTTSRIGDGFMRFMGWSRDRHRSCGSAATTSSIMSRSKKADLLCWNFIKDIRDLLCNFAWVGETPTARYDADLHSYIDDPLKPRDTYEEEDPGAGPSFVERVPEVVARSEDEVVIPTAQADTCALDADLSTEIGNQLKYRYKPSTSQAEDIRARTVATRYQVEPPRTRTSRTNYVSAPSSRHAVDLKTIVQVDGRSLRVPKEKNRWVCSGTVCADYAGSSQEAVLSDYPFVNADDMADHPRPPSTAPAAARPASSGSSASKISAMSSVYSSLKSYKLSGYSKTSLRAGAVWLEDKLGAFGTILASPLKLLVVTLDVMRHVLARAIMAAARNFHVCPIYMTDPDCICKVIEPMIEMIDDLFRTPPPLEGETRAVTINIGAGGELEFMGGWGLGGGLYATLYWMKAGKTNIGVEIGGYYGPSMTTAIGTELLHVGVGVYLELGVFYGLRKEMSEYSKGINVGLDVGLRAKISLELLFREEYIDIDYKTRCSPLDYGMSGSTVADLAARTARMYVWPVNPVCIRGFAIGLHFGTGVFKVGDFNVYTTMGASKSVALWQWERSQTPAGKYISDSMDARFKGDKLERERARVAAETAAREKAEAEERAAREKAERERTEHDVIRKYNAQHDSSVALAAAESKYAALLATATEQAALVESKATTAAIGKNPTLNDHTRAIAAAIARIKALKTALQTASEDITSELSILRRQAEVVLDKRLDSRSIETATSAFEALLARLVRRIKDAGDAALPIPDLAAEVTAQATAAVQYIKEFERTRQANYDDKHAWFERAWGTTFQGKLSKKSSGGMRSLWGGRVDRFIKVREGQLIAYYMPPAGIVVTDGAHDVPVDEKTAKRYRLTAECTLELKAGMDEAAGYSGTIAADNLYFKLTCPEISKVEGRFVDGDRVSQEFYPADKHDMLKWVAFLDSMITILKAQAARLDWERDHGRFVLKRVSGGPRHLVDVTVDGIDLPAPAVEVPSVRVDSSVRPVSTVRRDVAVPTGMGTGLSTVRGVKVDSRRPASASASSTYYSASERARIASAIKGGKPKLAAWAEEDFEQNVSEAKSKEYSGLKELEQELELA